MYSGLVGRGEVADRRADVAAVDVAVRRSPVSVNSIRPTRNFAVPSALTGRLLTVSTSAAISLVNGVFQFAVLSSTISTFGRPLARAGGCTNRSMSSAAAGAGTAPAPARQP